MGIEQVGGKIDHSEPYLALIERGFIQEFGTNPVATDCIQASPRPCPTLETACSQKSTVSQLTSAFC